MTSNPIIWASKTTRINIDTGEVITENQSKNLIKIKTTKHVSINKNKTKGFIEYTIEYRGNNQLELFYHE